MTRAQSLVLPLVSTSLFLLAYYWLRLSTRPMAGLFGEAPGMAAAFTLARLAGLVAIACLLLAAAFVAIPAALRPAGPARKVQLVLPLFLLLGTVAAIKLYFLKIGTVGDFARLPGVGDLNFATTWIAVGTLLGTLAVAVALLKVPLARRFQRRTWMALLAAGAACVVLWLATAFMLLTALTQPPSAGGPGGGSATGAAAGVVSTLRVGGLLMTLFLAALLLGLRRGRRAEDPPASAATEPDPSTPATRREAGRAVAYCLGIGVVLLAVSQLVPAPRTNPPPEVALVFDSPETQQLAERACMACHSHETEWPWYASVAPASWLVTSHVTSGRAGLNFSALNEVEGDRRERVPDQVVRTIERGFMPPADFLYLHPEARLTDAEKEQLAAGMKASLAAQLAR